MFTKILFTILSIITSALIYILTKLYTIWWLFWVPIVALPVLYLAYVGIYLVILLFWGMCLDGKKVIEKPNPFYYWIVKQTCSQLVICSGAITHVTGKELLPRDQKFMIISNHTSAFDPLLMVKEIPTDPVICVTKPENEKIPVCGPFIHAAGFIAIDRNNNMKALASIVKASRYIKNNEGNVYICPEGTRSKIGDLLEFKAGSFKIAYKSECPIVIASIKNADKIHKHFPFRRTHVYIDILKVINYEDYKDITTTDLAVDCREIIRNHLKSR